MYKQPTNDQVPALADLIAYIELERLGAGSTVNKFCTINRRNTALLQPLETTTVRRGRQGAGTRWQGRRHGWRRETALCACARAPAEREDLACFTSRAPRYSRGVGGEGRRASAARLGLRERRESRGWAAG
jgi:hypothetical protein